MGECHVIGVVYVPQGTLKKDRGNIQPCNAAGYFKRLFTLVTSEDKLNFHLVLSVLERHLDMLLHSGPRSTQKLLKMFQSVPGEFFFLERDLGIQSFDGLLCTMLWATGVHAHKLQLPNMALRHDSGGGWRRNICVKTRRLVDN